MACYIVLGDKMIMITPIQGPTTNQCYHTNISDTSFVLASFRYAIITLHRIALTNQNASGAIEKCKYKHMDLSVGAEDLKLKPLKINIYYNIKWMLLQF